MEPIILINQNQDFETLTEKLYRQIIDYQIIGLIKGQHMIYIKKLKAIIDN